jgi:hypothetical protein
MKKIFQSLCVVLMLALFVSIPVSAETTAKKKLTATVAGSTIYTSKASSHTYELYLGSTGTSKAEIDTNITDSRCTWKSSNTSIATVNEDGTVTFKKAGKVKVTCTSPKKQKLTFVFNVKKITSLKANFTKATLEVGERKTIKATVSPAAAVKSENDLLTYTSSNEAVATVTNKGVIKAVGAGKATITVKTTDVSGRTAKIKITVPEEEKDEVSNLTFNYSAAKETMTFAINGSMKFSSPSSAKNVFDRIAAYMYKNAGLTGSLNDMWLNNYQVVISSNGIKFLKNGKGADQWTNLNKKTYGKETVKTYLTPAKAKTFVKAVVTAGQSLTKTHTITGSLTLTRGSDKIVLTNIKISKDGVTFTCNKKSASMVISTSGIQITNCPELADYLVAVSGGLLK